MCSVLVVLLRIRKACNFCMIGRSCIVSQVHMESDYPLNMNLLFKMSIKLISNFFVFFFLMLRLSAMYIFQIEVDSLERMF